MKNEAKEPATAVTTKIPQQLEDDVDDLAGVREGVRVATRRP